MSIKGIGASLKERVSFEKTSGGYVLEGTPVCCTNPFSGHNYSNFANYRVCNCNRAFYIQNSLAWLALVSSLKKDRHSA